MLGNPLLLGDDGYNISRSVRLRSSASAYLNRTPASAGNQQKWTWSGWAKRGSLGAQQLFGAGAGTGGSPECFIDFEDNLNFQIFDGTSNLAVLRSNAVYRDPSAWYHVVVAIDTTQATAANRVLLYINGQQVTSFTLSTYPSQNLNTQVNAATVHKLGMSTRLSGYYWDGYMTEINFVDGQALTPSSFGETDAVTGVWKPKKYAGTYGTNGFYLPFSDNSSTAALGFDRRTSLDSYNLTGYNGAALTTSVVKYGTAALALGSAGSRYVNSNGSYGNHTPDYNIYNKNFTIEFWWRGQASDFNFGSIDGVLSGYNYLLGKGRVNTASYGWGIHVYSGGSIGFEEFTGGAGGSVSTSGVNILDNAWHHFAFTRSGSTTSIYVDGVQRATGTLNGNTDNTYGISINAMWDYTNGNLLTYFGGGTMDDLRFYNGVTKYTGAFTSPAAALPIGEADPFWSYVVLAMPMDGTNGATAIPVYASNRWTTNNISLTAGVTYDSMLDVPTMWADGGNGRGNYCVINPLDKGSSGTISDGNLATSSQTASANGSFGLTTGKWYFEASFSSITGASSLVEVGIQAINIQGYLSSGNKDLDTAQTAYGATYTTSDIIGCAFDLDAKQMTFYKNGTSQGTFTYTVADTYFPMIRARGTTTFAGTLNFGQRPFAYTPPTGFRALNTQNLPDSTIRAGNKFFDATLYTGNGTSQNVVNSGGFQPDLFWAKKRSAIGSHAVFDSVRGANQGVYPDLTAVEGTWSGQAFLSNGFTVNATYSGETNGNGITTVAWQWKKSVSAGFDIVTFNSPASGAFTVNHSLGVAPKMIITKERYGTLGWLTYHASVNTKDDYMLLNSTAAKSGVAVGSWGAALPTSTQFGMTVGVSVNASKSVVAYLFAEVAGFSRFGSYTGNGSADGPFVWCGFRPRFILVKRTDSSTNGNWEIIDTSRDTYNQAFLDLSANLSAVENATDGAAWDILSNGFKCRDGTSTGTKNVSGGTYIFAAFAESPFKNSLAR